MRRKKTWALIAAVAMVTTLFVPAAGANPWETADIFGQGMGGPLVADDGAEIRRTATGVTASVTMPTPDLNNYLVPPRATWPTSSGLLGSPAAFSLWVFLFFNPEECANYPDPCLPGDLSDPDVVAAGYNAGGHLVSGPSITISGRVNAQSQAFGPPGVPVCTDESAGASVCVETIGQALDMGIVIDNAEIHLAVAPHGKLDPSLMPAQISTPAGSVFTHWWVALFD